ncbi:hypothetical protein DYU05_11275 [Mucilaginibacter terrenus]|uniref:Uncharacterized protein n=1 Tax=Mucilaginibacter terrenus TaxID=2482727 RepID=A0A3E2NP37_9SPHI|nr:hypothetical protein [Mucilaginibacter terrenus]RFZ82747.1 hypothetical protein DYU05_11275 [Mucilaginibacter terrenus]
MKYLYITAVLLGLAMFTSCGKKNDTGPVPHNIKVVATGSANFTALLSVIKSTSTTSSTLDTKAVTTGSYEFSTPLSSGDRVHFEIQTTGENVVSYTITDNGATAAQQTDKELSSYTKTFVDFTVN